MLNKLELVLYRAFATSDLGFTLHFFSRLEPFQMNSITEMAQATPIPAIKTTKTPPTLSRVSSLALSLIPLSLVSHCPPPLLSFHHLFFSSCRTPSSWSCRMARSMGTLKWDPGVKAMP